MAGCNAAVLSREACRLPRRLASMFQQVCLVGAGMAELLAVAGGAGGGRGGGGNRSSSRRRGAGSALVFNQRVSTSPLARRLGIGPDPRTDRGAPLS